MSRFCEWFTLTTASPLSIDGLKKSENLSFRGQAYHPHVTGLKMNKRILIIDDEDDIREIVQLTLETVQGWRVLTAGSGEDGVASASKERPDAILLDVMMPNMDGPATLQELRAKPETRAIPVILLTAKVQSADRRRFASMGVQAVISKPFDPLKLAEQITAALRWN